MNKKLMALAVAGALAAPAAALAQTTIYGTLKAEWGIASQPNTTATATRHDAESLNSGASNIGFRGEEKLGGNLAAWYQCESDLRFLGGTSTTSGSICDRNSALGLKGGFGNFYVGTWDSPIKRASGVTRITEERAGRARSTSRCHPLRGRRVFRTGTLRPSTTIRRTWAVSH
jgi:predicted porin